MPYRGDDELRCPHCEETALSRQTLQWIERRGCTGCGGVWFDAEALVELGDDLRVRLRQPFGKMQDTDAPRSCPRCVTEMTLELVAYKKDSIPIDVCHDCGVWFDKDELEPFLQLVMDAEDGLRSPFSRSKRPWWAATLSFLVNSLAGGGNKRVGWK